MKETDATETASVWVEQEQFHQMKWVITMYTFMYLQQEHNQQQHSMLGLAKIMMTTLNRKKEINWMYSPFELAVSQWLNH